MAGIDKAAIGFTIAIVAIGAGIALYGDTVQNAGSGISAPTVDISDQAKPLKAGWERARSVQDPGIGHESHQIVILLPPSDNVYSGTLAYDASEPIQLITLHGPLAPGEDVGQAIWTPDGETKFALTFVDPENAQGTWEFAGNALAVHTLNTEQFTVDYKVDYTEKEMSDTVITGTATSVQDPGIGHESHQITVLLGPSSDTYSGILSYAASENIQLISLRGPIGADESPERIWTPDGETIFELTFIEPNNAMGSWEFEGNAVAVHTLFPTPFTVSYSISATADAAAESLTGSDSQTPLKAGWERARSVQDPGIGHESHQIVILLPPSDNVYSGTLAYDASEPIQLITLHGPLAPGEDVGQAIWTPDGETKFALTFVDPENAQGTWEFAGNALAVHTLNTEQFTVDYKVDYTEKEMSDTVITGTATSVQDPGIGHESHQITVLLGPSSDTYSGILSYAASENIQLISLRGPIGADESPERIWTPDGETIFELTFIEPNNAMGSWEFEGNAVAVHTLFPTPFTVSYSISATADAAAESLTGSDSQTVIVDMPAGTSVPGCEATNECYIPASVTINVGDTVEWVNSDTVVHLVTSGSISGASGEFDSGLIMADASFAFTFEESGSYDYFCLVHPWMSGNVQVN